MRVLAIDPGCTDSGYALIDSCDCRPIEVGKIRNDDLLDEMPSSDHYAIEMVASYGMAVGAEVFQTVRWIGRFEQVLVGLGSPVELVYRRDVKLHLCRTSKAKDANITQALLDRFAPGQPNRGKGTKAAPGFFHGFAADMWQAFALAVLVADRLEHRDAV